MVLEPLLVGLTNMFDIGGFIRVDSVNYPSLIACTLFTRGCNFRCPYCHNPAFVVPSDSTSITQPAPQETYSVEEILSYIEQRRGLLDAVVVSGGEPCLQKGLKDFLLQVKKMGLKTKLDTNGSLPLVLENLLESKLVDYVAMDIKTAPEKYKLIGFDNCNLISQSIGLIMQKAPDYEFRTTCVKPIVEPEDFKKIATWISGAKRFYLQSFKNEVTLDPAYERAISFTDAELSSLANELKTHIKFIDIR